MRRLPLALAAATLLAGCGTTGSDQSGRAATLALGHPGAVHAGLYLAHARGFDEAEGVPLTIAPTRDPVGALTQAKADLAILDIHDLAVARAHGADLVAVMAIVERPVAELRPARYRRRSERTPGAPDYPELVLTTLRSTLTDEPGVARGAVAALQRGYREAFVDPESAVQALVAEVPSLEAPAVAAALDRLGPDFQGSAQTLGELDPSRLRAWAAWEARTGIVKRAPDVAQAFDGRYVRPG